jgi:dTDP-4-dehydrorhamnose 3,5-epimerase
MNPEFSAETERNAALREIHSTEIHGCVEIRSHIRGDTRGRFVKIFHKNWFDAHGLRSDFVEMYYTVSHRRVLRGMHFQIPPVQHAKLVACVEGTVLDAAVDLRGASPTFGRHILRTLSADEGNMLYLPEGLAHGFYVLSETATVLYAVTSAYSAPCDSGIHWKSVGIDWPDLDPIVSKRDQELPPMAQATDVFRNL